MHNWSTFGAKTSHKQTQTHKTHHTPDLGEATTFPLIAYFVPLHKAHIQMAFCPETPKWKSWNCQRWDSPQLWGPIILHVDIWLRWGLNQSCSPRQELFNGMLHATCTQGNRVDSRLLVVGNQIANSTHGPSFGHNLCFTCPNGSCELILDIYVPRAFNDIMNSSSHWVLAPTIVFWRFRSPPGLHLPKREFTWKCKGSLLHTFLHSREHLLKLYTTSTLS